MLLSLVPHSVYRKEYFMSNDTILFLHNIHWGFHFLYLLKFFLHEVFLMKMWQEAL